MKTNKKYLLFLIAGAVAFLVSFLSLPRVKLAVNDLPLLYVFHSKAIRNKINKSLKPVKIIAVAIDDDSLMKIPARWPWPRSVYASLVRTLDAEGARVIGMDLIFQGKSEETGQDELFARSLKDTVNARVVLALGVNEATGAALAPQPEFAQSAYGVGLVRTITDEDNTARRLKVSSETPGARYDSFVAQMVAAYSGIPVRDVTAAIPASADGTFRINFLASEKSPGSVRKVSFYDVYQKPEELKKINGRDFFKDSIVLVYPHAELLHDVHITPLGLMRGGFVNINGLLDVLNARFLIPASFPGIFCMLFSALVLFFFLRNPNFLIGLAVTAGVICFDFLFLVVALLNGFISDYFYQIAVFCGSFFLFANLIKYSNYLYHIQRIKSKATMDPLRGIYTLRYFYYKMDIEDPYMQGFRRPYLVFVSFDSLNAEIKDLPISAVKEIWQEIAATVNQSKSFWAGYSQEEIAGRVISSPNGIERLVRSLTTSLGALLREKGLKIKVRAAYLPYKREYNLKQILYLVFNRVKDQKEEIALLDPDALLKETGPSVAQTGLVSDSNILESLSEDIEERNRTLLTLIDNLGKEYRKNQEMFFQVILSLVNALEARDPYSEGHSQRVASYALALAEKLGWNKEEKEKLRKAGLLHDLGKIGIPDGILHKKDRLTEDEFDFIKKHEIIAVKILEPLSGIKEILPWILYHHERWDGKGYPHGLGGNAIPIGAQMISLADVYDALTTGRDYKKALSSEESLQEIARNKGIQFNPELTEVFIGVMREIRP